jgi:hypothetical protein
MPAFLAGASLVARQKALKRDGETPVSIMARGGVPGELRSDHKTLLISVVECSPEQRSGQ